MKIKDIAGENLNETNLLYNGIHSRHIKWFRNNFEKDIVIAYLKDRFSTIMLVKKCGGKVEALTFTDTLNLGLDGFSTFNFNIVNVGGVVEIFNQYSDDVKVVDEERYNQIKREIIISKIENGV